MHLKDDIRPLIPVAPETQVDSQNRPEDQLLAQQNTSRHKKRCAKSSRLRLGAADQPEDNNLLENFAHRVSIPMYAAELGVDPQADFAHRPESQGLLGTAVSCFPSGASRVLD